LLEAQHPAGNVLLLEVVIPQPTVGSDATRLDTTMLGFTGRGTPRSSIKTCSIAGLTLVKTTPTASELSILEATPAEDGQR
jgi:hypothetical protein